LLTRYYDPMYLYQLGNKRERILFRGDKRLPRLLCQTARLNQRPIKKTHMLKFEVIPVTQFPELLPHLV
jgi:hypothetical protein